ncbi:MAG: ABC transporter ATP-binding protein [Acidimicrobiales bacterium]
MNTAATTAEPPGTAAPVRGGGDSLLQVDGLSVRFGSVAAVTDVSFEVRRGEVVGLVGESGSGKSVTARAVLGLLKRPAAVSARSIRFDDVEVTTASPGTLRALRGGGIGLVFQDALAALDPVYPVGDQLVEALRAHRRVSVNDARQRASGLLDEVGLREPEAVLRSYPHQLSGGQRQRVVIAAALIADPSLVIADEPTTALDVTLQRRVLDLLLDVTARRQLSVLLITHDLGVVAETCDRVLVLYGGTLVEEANADDLFRRPRHPYTKALLAAVPRLGERGRFSTISGNPIRVFGSLDTCPFAPRCPKAEPVCAEALPPLFVDGGHRHRCLFPEDDAP